MSVCDIKNRNPIAAGPGFPLAPPHYRLSISQSFGVPFRSIILSCNFEYYSNVIVELIYHINFLSNFKYSYRIRIETDCIQNLSSIRTLSFKCWLRTDESLMSNKSCPWSKFGFVIADPTGQISRSDHKFRKLDQNLWLRSQCGAPAQTFFDKVSAYSRSFWCNAGMFSVIKLNPALEYGRIFW